MKAPLIEKLQFSDTIIGFVFQPKEKIDFQAGQFLEWILPHPNPDDRGVKRHFTISSSPTEDNLMLTTKFSTRSSSFKKALQQLKIGDEIEVGHVEGDFTLPDDPSAPLVFIAGGIGVTPFRSMIKFLFDTGQKRDITLLYSNKTPADIVFKDLYDDASAKVGFKVVYVLTDPAPPGWQGDSGFIDEAMIKQEVPDWQRRTFYVSGPEPMVEAFEKMLGEMGISEAHLKRDFFPGYTETHQAK